ncbi:zinc-dependent alcohol dehydrogenase [Teichococcus vastitatis]|uniref:Glutathione-dependent formaldehyde dehydrogenase n=1 Tax=Teichococcus vastitatis TaxID=2307076 RepID=A0ABS9W791_9PROT|nr:zinc-dependent alcohol dehydrogenase [Pseudoroseomonas vastitatis]MCI0755102.1 glutathione-dependent formaldehyde dehydrogenase [Pseudoroseomonas vastitatis]
MKALAWHGKNDIRCDNVTDPGIEDARDVIIKVTSCAICGSDLHLMDGQMPAMKSGDVLGHEFMGEVVETGSPNHRLKKGDRIVVPFNINCGECSQCRRGNWACCLRSNRNGAEAATMFGYPTAGLFGYSHLTGGYWGGQAEYVRVPMADVAPMKVPEGMSDEQALFLTDILPTGWQAAVHCDLKGGETVAIWGAGPVGLFTIKSAQIMGAERIIVIETVPERMALARQAGATHIIDLKQEEVIERIKEITDGEGPDAVIDCVGMEATAGHGMLGMLSKVQETLTSTQRPYALEQAVQAVRGGGIVSVPGVYGGPIPVHMGAVVQKGLTIRSGQTHVKRYLEELTGLIQQGRIDPTFLITHRSTSLEQGPELYKTFRDKQDGCVKVVFNLN